MPHRGVSSHDVRFARRNAPIVDTGRVLAALLHGRELVRRRSRQAMLELRARVPWDGHLDEMMQGRFA
jgi:hypothetical protein